MRLGYDAQKGYASLRLTGDLLRRIARASKSLSLAARDAIALSVLGLLLGIYEYYTGLAEKLLEFALEYKDYEADNLFFVIFMSSVGFMVFGFRRVNELSAEIEARRNAESKASALARHDPLTGLPNRRFFIEMLDDVLAKSTPESPCAVLLLDLDGFKLVNDAYGHAVGDQLLIEFTRRVSSLMRAGAKLIRIGGDEFAVVVPEAVALDAPAALAHQIVAQVAEPFSINDISASIGVGVGIAVAPADGREPELLVQRADRALYRAKSEGSSRIRFFEAELDADVDRRIALELDLRAAIAAGAIIPFFQPIVSLKDERIIGFEALARWKNANGDWVAPGVFIPMAEDLGLIGKLGDQLLRRACLDARDWPSNLTLSFNISSRQLSDPAVGLRVLSILAETGFSPLRLEIEITETAAVDNIKVVQSVTGQLRQAGVRIALDDFGTGYSTFAQLLLLKPDRIKIDRSFVDRLGDDRDRTTIVRALLGLAGGFDLATTAEGIETERQLATLSADGCLDGQGYLFSKAVPADAVPSLLEKGTSRKKAAA